MLATVLLLAADAAASGGGGSGLPELPPAAQYGLLGFLVVALATGKLLVPRYILDRERERADRMEQENVRLNTLMQEKTIPAVVDATVAVRDSTLLVHNMKRDRDREQGHSNDGGS